MSGTSIQPIPNISEEVLCAGLVACIRAEIIEVLLPHGSSVDFLRDHPGYNSFP